MFILLPIVAVLLLATFVGIPLGLFLLLGLALLYTVGYVVGAHAIGRRVIAYPKSRYAAFLAGWGIVRLLGLIPIVGGLLWALVTIFGLGVIVTTARRPRVEGSGHSDSSSSSSAAARHRSGCLGCSATSRRMSRAVPDSRGAAAGPALALRPASVRRYMVTRRVRWHDDDRTIPGGEPPAT